MIPAYKAMRRRNGQDYGHGNFRYEEGKTYSHSLTGEGRTGLHCSRDPLFCLNWSFSSDTVYRKVTVIGAICQREDNPNVIATDRLSIGPLLSPEEMDNAAVEERMASAVIAAVGKSTSGWQIVNCDRSGISYANHYMSVARASATRTAAISTGEGVSVAEGKGASATSSLLAVGYNGAQASGKKGCLLLLTDTGGNSVLLRVGQNGIKEGVFYKLQRGKINERD